MQPSKSRRHRRRLVIALTLGAPALALLATAAVGHADDNTEQTSYAGRPTAFEVNQLPAQLENVLTHQLDVPADRIMRESFVGQDAVGATLDEADWPKATSFSLFDSTPTGDVIRWYLERSGVVKEVEQARSCERFPDGFVTSCENTKLPGGRLAEISTASAYVSQGQIFVLTAGAQAPDGAHTYTQYVAKVWRDSDFVSAVSDLVPADQLTGQKPALGFEQLLQIADDNAAWMDEPPTAADGCAWVAPDPDMVRSCGEAQR